ncbi:uncharacterized protein K452DRAFT_290651 [Aplosporella prunicola CBS 121167]|uniref:DUF7726 domain-containing protein n=1 Tax=Aplosporella prunicola CBS 121167 TaxID=1176127 RepID=A0A6A6B6U0_9PEZI|nr:uncharacterized protein K452DRAFT_290651 [Aplosporella prunicola CBS 121167]KAF2138511.1 hypothetical protein K452DRAFT_290651 [Aplosporella prunicola CBS 121167]
MTNDRGSDGAANSKPDDAPKTGEEEPKTGDKRAAPDDANDAHSESDHEEDTSYISLDGEMIDKNPDQVRRQIHRFLDNGGMKVGEFQSAIGVSSNAYSRFMGQQGPTKGQMSDVYQNAWAFFKKRELKGIPMPRKKAKKADESDEKDQHVGRRRHLRCAPAGGRRRRGRGVRHVRRDPQEDQRAPAQARRDASAVLPRPGGAVPRAEEAVAHPVVAAGRVPRQKGPRGRQH